MNTANKQEKIKQHYVPQHYLRYFANLDNDNYFCYVYDKQITKIYPKNVKNIAQEEFFYAISDEDVDNIKSKFPDLIVEVKNELQQYKANLAYKSDDLYKHQVNLQDYLISKFEEQYSKKVDNNFFENFFELIETDYSKIYCDFLNEIDQIKDEIIISTRQKYGIINNEKFVECANEQIILQNQTIASLINKYKKEIAFYIALQTLRTKNVRNSTSSLLNQVNDQFMKPRAEAILKEQLNNMPDFPLKFEDITIEMNPYLAQYYHMNLLFSMLPELVIHLCNQDWKLGFNFTEIPLCTSNSPIIYLPNTPNENPLYGHGLFSPDITYAFPLTPYYLMQIIDENSYNYTFKEIVHIKLINCFNLPKSSVIKHNNIRFKLSPRLIYSNNNNFSEICGLN